MPLLKGKSNSHNLLVVATNREQSGSFCYALPSSYDTSFSSLKSNKMDDNSHYITAYILSNSQDTIISSLETTQMSKPENTSHYTTAYILPSFQDTINSVLCMN